MTRCKGEWIKNADGKWYNGGRFYGQALTDEEYQALPNYCQVWPESGHGCNFLAHTTWASLHALECQARTFGGRFVEKWAMKLLKGGVSPADAIRQAMAIAPKARPADFPTLSKLMLQSGRVREAIALRAPQFRAGLAKQYAPQVQAQAPSSGSIPPVALLVLAALAFLVLGGMI